MVIDFKKHVTDMYLIKEPDTKNTKTEKPEEETINIILASTEMKQEAKLKELSSWKEHDVYDEVQASEQPCISTRWVLKEKQKEDKEIYIKARLCARGFEEDTSDIRSDSPTAMKETIRFALSIASSNSWKIQSLDVKTAFLQ